MHKFELAQNIAEFLQLTQEGSLVHIVRVLASFDPYPYEVIGKIVDTGRGKKSQASEVKEIKQRVGQLISQLQSFQPRQVYFAIKEFKSGLEQFNEAIGVAQDDSANELGDASITGLRNQVDDFLDAYENFQKKSGAMEAFQLATVGKILASSLESATSVLLLLKCGLESGVSPEFELEAHDNGEQEGQEMSLLLPNIIDYRDLAAKLRALDIIYDELCSLAGVSFPLQIISIESGSLWLRLFGESRVIKALVSLGEFVLLFLYRNYTDEGRPLTIGIKLRPLDDLLRWKHILEEAGIDCSVVDDILKKALIKISKEYLNLLLGQPWVRIDKVTHSLPKESQEKYARESSRRLLRPGSPETEGE